MNVLHYKEHRLDDFFESGPLLLLFISFGRFLENIAKVMCKPQHYRYVYYTAVVNYKYMVGFALLILFQCTIKYTVKNNYHKP